MFTLKYPKNNKIVLKYIIIMDENMESNEEEYLDMEMLEQLPLTFVNVARCLKKAFRYLDAQNIRDEDLIVGIGDTGSGKSTILMSLAYGSGCLEARHIEEDVHLGGDRTKRVTKPVIDKKDICLFEKKFAIGHSKDKTCTFKPTFIKQSINGQGIVFADIARLKEAKHMISRIVNGFVNRKILAEASTVKFIVMVTEEQASS